MLQWKQCGIQNKQQNTCLIIFYIIWCYVIFIFCGLFYVIYWVDQNWFNFYGTTQEIFRRLWHMVQIPYLLVTCKYSEVHWTTLSKIKWVEKKAKTSGKKSLGYHIVICQICGMPKAIELMNGTI